MATMTLGQIRATPLGKKPIIEEMTAMVDHAIDHETELVELRAALALPAKSWPTAFDTAHVIEEDSGAPNAYHAVVSGATPSVPMAEGLVYWLHGAVPNTGACTLSIDSQDGIVPIKKKTPSGLVDLSAGEMPQYGAQVYFSNANSVWVLINPTITGVSHNVVASIEEANAGSFNEGDFVYVLE